MSWRAIGIWEWIKSSFLFSRPFFLSISQVSKMFYIFLKNIIYFFWIVTDLGTTPSLWLRLVPPFSELFIGRLLVLTWFFNLIAALVAESAFMRTISFLATCKIRRLYLLFIIQRNKLFQSILLEWLRLGLVILRYPVKVSHWLTTEWNVHF